MWWRREFQGSSFQFIDFFREFRLLGCRKLFFAVIDY
jgi:hypothetical protein